MDSILGNLFYLSTDQSHNSPNGGITHAEAFSIDIIRNRYWPDKSSSENVGCG